MSDLTHEQQEAYLRARRLGSPEGIRQTLEDLERAADNSRLPGDIMDLCDAAATTIRSLHHQVESREALLRHCDRRHKDVDQ